MHRLRAPRSSSWSASLLLAGLTACSGGTPEGPYARAKVIEGLDETIGGDIELARPPTEEEDLRGRRALPGDFLIENDKFRVAILSGRNSKGPGLYGGSVVDADLQRNDARYDGGRGRDQWNEMFPLASMNVPFAALATDGAAPAVRVLADGADGGAAVIRVSSPATPFLSLLDLLWGLVNMPDMWLTTDYVAEPGRPWLKMRTTVTFQGDTEVADGAPMIYPTGELDVIKVGLEQGVVMGDFFLAGGSVDVFAPGIGFDEDGAVFRRVEAGDNIFADPFEFPFIAAVGNGVSYGMVPREGSVFVPLFTSSQTAVVSGLAPANPDVASCAKVNSAPFLDIGTLSIEPEEESRKPRYCADDAFTYERYFLIGDGDVGSILDQVIELRNTIAAEEGRPDLAIPFGDVRGHVREGGSGQPLSEVDVFVFEPGATSPYSQWRTDHSLQDETADGFFEGHLPVGPWELLVHQQGRADPPRIPVEVRAGETLQVLLEAPRPGFVRFTIRDETGRNVPSKLTILREDPASPSSRQPALGDPFIAGAPEWVVFTDDGVGEVALPPGRFRAVASRGVEYEIDVSDVFEVSGEVGVDLQLQVIRSIDTTGWISADLHVHSAPSHDSGVTLPARVTTMVAEGVEFFTSNDHDSITDFAPTVEEMGVAQWVQPAVGVETTTVEIGHFLAFPLQQDFLGDVGGAMDWTGMTPVDIVAELRQQGVSAGYDPTVFVAHPRDGILGYFDQFGFDPFVGEPGEGGTPGAPVYASGFSFDPLGSIDNPNPILASAEMTLDIDALELFTGKRLDTHRTATVDEVIAFNTGAQPAMYPWIERTLAEQQALIDGSALPNGEIEGVVDDWFALLNLGHRITAIGNSDTHGLTSTEAGCPRNFVLSSTDDPGVIDDQEIADAIKDHHVVASYGPYVQVVARQGGVSGIVGDEIAVSAGPIALEIEVQAPTWIDVDRVEVYENGTLVAERVLDAAPGPLRFADTIEVTPTQDAWYVVIVSGDGSMTPVFTDVEIPYVPLDEAVVGALGGLSGVGALIGSALEGVAFPKLYPIHPFALTNPIWVDVGGDGWTPPGHPAWWVPGEVVIPEAAPAE